jgi:hypothetical protein
MSVQIVILQNTHNGRDTHIRGIKIFSPRDHKSFDQGDPNFSTTDFTQYQFIR